jgi:A/G-specific adenine glycosylase
MSRELRPASSRRQRFVRQLLRWYARNGRKLPWRRTRDPYRILVSEIMLHQTQVPRVIPKYREFLRKYPSLEALARASTREVRELWYPLGYNVRPVRLRAIARTIVDRYDGRLPDTHDDLLKLKGIGRYTAGALLTFAHGKPAPILDTNVRRVLTRVFLAGRRVPDGDLWALADALLPRRRAYDYNQALMDFGATVCTARTPRCPICPLQRMCRAYPAMRPRS